MPGAVVLNGGLFSSTGDIWQCLKILLVFITGSVLAASSG